MDPSRPTSVKCDESSAKFSRQRRRGTTIFPLILATACLLFAVAMWVIQAEAFQGVNRNYKKPYFLAYWSHISYAVMYIVWKLWRVSPSTECNCAEDRAITNSRTLMACSGFLALLIMVTSYLWIQSLGQTNIPANTAIYQSGCAVVFILSVPILKERVTVLKVMSVVLSIAGVSLLSVFSNNSQCQSPNSTNQTLDYGVYIVDLTDTDTADPCTVENSTPLGYVFLGLSVLTYSLFQVLYKKLVTKLNDPAAAMNSVRLLGYFGIHILFWMWPPILILHFTGIEVFEWPPSWSIFGYMILQGLISLIYKMLLLFAIALTSPLYTSVGTMLVAPCSVLIDWLVHQFLLSWPAFIGMSLILLGFGGFIISQYVQSRRHARRTEGTSQTVIQADKYPMQKDSGEEVTLLTSSKEPHSYKFEFIHKYIA